MKKFLIIFLFLFNSIAAFAQSNFDPKSLLSGPTGKPRLVNDYANVLTADQKQALENKLDIFDDSTSNQVAVFIIPTLGDYDISDYSVKLGRAWGVGGKQFNNGVVLLISTGDRQVEIATGYGLEGALPDVTCKEIIDDIITPDFKGNDYYAGINEGTDAIIKATKGEYKAPEGYRQGSDGFSFAKIIFIVIIIIVFLSIISRGGGGGFGGWLGPALWMMMGSGRSRGGGGFGGGSNGGGFGGFGGGSFGGGGASGSW